MDRNKIRRLPNLSEKDRQAEEYFITQACEHTEEYLTKYRNMPQSFHGQYICSDLFKETFDIYKESVATRNLYASAIHNSAATLANEQFQRKVKDPNLTDCIFLTGIPGAGKSFFIQSLILEGELPPTSMVFEGDINSLETIKQKMSVALEYHKNLHIIIINPTLELAYHNQWTRLKEIGRGASIHTMARIISGIPSALQELYYFFNKQIEIGIYNKTSNQDIEIYMGIEYASLLNHGSYDEIKFKLQAIRQEILERENQNEQNKEQPKIN